MSNRLATVLLLLAMTLSAGCDAVHNVMKEVHGAGFGEPSAGTYTAGTFDVWVGGKVERVVGATVAPEFFLEAKAQPVLGRPLLAEEGPGRGAVVAILSYDFWATRFGSDPAIIGRKVRIGRSEYTVVGVAPKGFAIPPGAAIWVSRY